MTIHEAGGYLYQWFSDNDCYSPEKDYNKLVLISETNEEDQAAIECALESFEEASIVRKKEINNQTYWVLQKDFALIEQSIPISASTASIVYDHVKYIRERCANFNRLNKNFIKKVIFFLPNKKYEYIYI